MKSRPQLFIMLFAAISLTACVSHMYPKTRVPEVTIVEKGKQFSTSHDIVFKTPERANQTILYSGVYTHVLKGDTGEFYAHSSRMIGLKPQFCSTEKFEGGIYVPFDKTQQCLVYWFIPDLYGKGIIVQLFTGESGKLEFYTWIPRDLGELPMCRIS